MHSADDCEHSSVEEKKAFKYKVAAAKARNGPARSTRSQLFSADDATSSSSKSVGRLREDKKGCDEKDNDNSTSCIMTVSDSKASIDATGLCDDASDGSIASTTLAERAVIKGIGKIEAIDTDWLEVALTEKDNKPKLYKLSRAWCVPSTALHLNSGRLALKNIRYVAADDSMACADLFIGHPVLLHLRVDTRSLLEDRAATLDGTDCSLDALPRTKSGRVSRRMLAHINRVGNDKMNETDQPTADSARRKVNYFSARAEDDPLPGPSLLDPID